VRLGSEEVSIVYRRGEAEMPAFAYEYEIAKLDGVRFEWNARPLRVVGNGAVEGLECARPDGSTFVLPCDMVIPAIGQARLGGVDLGSVNRETGQTANPKVFAGGDCVNGGREVVDAVADGKRAAAGISQWLT